MGRNFEACFFLLLLFFHQFPMNFIIMLTILDIPGEDEIRRNGTTASFNKKESVNMILLYQLPNRLVGAPNGGISICSNTRQRIVVVGSS